MTKITAEVRATIRSIVAASNSYDASTVRISRTGEVTACKDADKTYAAPETGRYLLGTVTDLLAYGEV